MGNFIQGNQDDGIALTGDQVRAISDTDPFGATFINAVSVQGLVASPTISITDNLIGGERNGLPAGNGGDGISIRNFGNTALSVAQGDIDADADDGDGRDPGGPDFPGAFLGAGAADLAGNSTSGPIPDITIADNIISRNNRIGVNARFNGGAGRFDLRTRPVNTDPAPVNTDDYLQLTLTGNTIVSNGEEGIFLRADSDMTQNRIVFVPNLDIEMDGAFDDNQVSPATVEMFSAFPAGDVDATLPFLNLATVQNTLFTVVGNTIQSNGTNTINGEGLEIRVGTGAYVAADVRDNIFGGNLEEDLFTATFHSDLDLVNAARVDPLDSVDNDGEFNFDAVVLDDAALLDMRFSGNVGDQINPLEDVAFLDDPGTIDPTTTLAQDINILFTNADPFKGATRRSGAFKIDDAFGLFSPANTFVELGVPQAVKGIGGAFSTYTLQNFSAESPWPEDPFADID